MFMPVISLAAEDYRIRLHLNKFDFDDIPVLEIVAGEFCSKIYEVKRRFLHGKYKIELINKYENAIREVEILITASVGDYLKFIIHGDKNVPDMQGHRVHTFVN